MLLGTISFAILAIGSWAACRSEERIEQGRPSAHLESWCAGLLIIVGHCDARPDHTFGSEAAVVSWPKDVRLTPPAGSRDFPLLSNSCAYDDGIKAPICRPNALSKALSLAGLSDVETIPIDIPAAFAEFQDYWKPFLGGTGSAPKYCMSLDEDTRSQIRDAVRAKLPTGPDGEILLAVRAWAVKGFVSG